jgi:cytochrome c oxidase assembly factor CtaG
MRHSHATASSLVPAMAGAALALLPAIASGHAVDDGAESRVVAWLEPLIAVVLLLACLAYLHGLVALWRRAGPGRGVRPWQALAFLVGLAAVVVALLSPIDALAAQLLTAHMVQHTLLIVVAAPLLVVAAPLPVLLAGLPAGWGRGLARWWGRRSLLRQAWAAVTGVLVATLAHGLAVWLWHVPGLYEAAIHDDLVHALEHLTFLVTALLFWWAVMDTRDPLAGGLGVVAVVATMAHGGLLAALLTLSPEPWYPHYAWRTRVWGLTHLEDQQLAGLVMWVPAGLAYLGIGLTLGVRWVRGIERRAALAPSALFRDPP